MPKDATLDRHLARIQRVIDHIVAHLDDPIDLDRLAEVACFSPHHFHRAYRYLLGETVADTVRRLRLHRAAGTLLGSETEVARIARQAGYGSAAAFSRAFAERYGRPPGAYRGTRRSFPFDSPEGETAMPDVTYRSLAPIRVAAVRHIGPYMEVGRSFDILMSWARARQLLRPGARSLGLYYDDPAAVAPTALRSDACLEGRRASRARARSRSGPLPADRMPCCATPAPMPSWSGPMPGCTGPGCRPAAPSRRRRRSSRNT
jgi:AraC family transcriptional regulator